MLKATVFGSGLVCPDPQHGQLELLPNFCWLHSTIFTGSGLVCPEPKKKTVLKGYCELRKHSLSKKTGVGYNQRCSDPDSSVRIRNTGSRTASKFLLAQSTVYLRSGLLLLKSTRDSKGGYRSYDNSVT